MLHIRLDEEGNQRCWKCGGKHFVQQRTTRSKVLFGFASLYAQPKLRCQKCGVYNKTVPALPWVPPEDRSFAERKKMAPYMTDQELSALNKAVAAKKQAIQEAEEGAEGAEGAE